MDKREAFFEAWSPRLLSVLRIVAALLFLAHGTAKLFHIPHLPQFDNLQLMSLEGVQGTIEVVGGVLLAIGLFSRPVAFILSGDMAFAYFIAHWPKNWLPLLNGGDSPSCSASCFSTCGQRVRVRGVSTPSAAACREPGPSPQGDGLRNLCLRQVVRRESPAGAARERDDR